MPKTTVRKKMNDNLEEIHGYVEELVFRKPENGFTVLELST